MKRGFPIRILMRDPLTTKSRGVNSDRSSVGLVVTVFFADGKTRTNTRYNAYLTHRTCSQRTCPRGSVGRHRGYQYGSAFSMLSTRPNLRQHASTRPVQPSEVRGVRRPVSIGHVCGDVAHRLRIDTTEDCDRAQVRTRCVQHSTSQWVTWCRLHIASLYAEL